MIPIPVLIIIFALGLAVAGLAASVIRSQVRFNWREDWPGALMMGGMTIAAIVIIIWGILS